MVLLISVVVVLNNILSKRLGWPHYYGVVSVNIVSCNLESLDFLNNVEISIDVF